MSLASGTRLGPYEIVGLIGEGGMGEVYKARDTRLDRTVAIKVLPSELSADAERRARFEREARAIASLSHPHICALFDIGEAAPSSPESAAAGPRDERVPSPESRASSSAREPALSEPRERRVEGQPLAPVHYLVMEHLTGQTLAERLRKGPLPLAQAIDIAAQIAEALDAAHKHGIIHRDLKPGNVMLTTGGTGRSGVTTAKLLDFGLAKLAGHGERPALAGDATAPTMTAPVTARGTILGTLPYMAPEQLEGKEADARTDLWALGTVLYEMVTGRRPFEGESQVSLIGNIMNAEPPALAQRQPLTPPPLDRVVRKCLAKRADDRWDTAHDVADELRWIAQTIEATVTGPRPTPGLVRNVLPALGGLVVGTLLATLVLWRFWPPPAPAVVRSTIELPPGSFLTLNVPTGRMPSRTEFAFSPDGEHLAISASRDRSESGAMLYLRGLDATDLQPIAGTEGARQPFFSPDGEWIGFWANGKLRKVQRRGGIPTELFASPSLPKGAFWSTDGTILLGGGGGLRRVPADGGTAEALTDIDPKKETEHTLPFLLPDGKTVLFTATPDSFGPRARVEAVTIGGGPRRQLIDDAADARYLQTGHIVFLRRGVLMAARFDPARLDLGPAVPLVEGVEQALNMGGSDYHSGAGQFSVSASGSLAYGAGGIGHLLESELVWVSRDGRAETLAGFDRTDAANQVRLSPDGRRLAFVQQSGPLWLFDLERGGTTRVTPDGLAAAPRWNPDRQRLSFAWSPAGASQAWQVSVAGGSDALEPLEVESAWLSSWSPDGRFLALVGRAPDTRTDILVYQVEDGKTRPYLHSRSAEEYPEFSPDGRWLAYVSDETGRPEVYLRSFPDPGRKFQVSSQGGNQPSWSPDMRELFYVSLPPRRMMKVDLRFSSDVWVGRSQPLFDFSFVSCNPVRGYELDRDGQRFLFTRIKRLPSAEITRINLVQNWFEELKRNVPIK